MTLSVLVIYLFLFGLSYLVYFSILSCFLCVSACITADSYNVTTTGRIKEAFSDKISHLIPEMRVEEASSACPALLWETASR